MNDDYIWAGGFVILMFAVMALAVFYYWSVPFPHYADSEDSRWIVRNATAPGQDADSVSVYLENCTVGDDGYTYCRLRD